MIKLTPTKIEAISVYILSWEMDELEEKLRERRVHLGLFDPEVDNRSIEAALAKFDLWGHVLAAHSLAEGEAKIVRFPKTVVEGVVFQTAKECAMYLSEGLAYEDIEEGYSMSRGFLGGIQEIK